MPVEYRLPFRISGGIPPYESRLLRDEDSNCPTWVTLFPDQRILAGTAPATAAGRTFFCIYQVTESDPGFRPQRSVTHGLRIEVTSPATGRLTLEQPDKIELSIGTFHSALLPAATGGVRPYRYALTCIGGALPAGMGFGPQTQTFSGTPEAPFRDSCTYSVTDSSQPAATVSVPVEVEVEGPVTGPLMLPASVVPRLSVGDFYNEPLPAATGGVQPYTYSFTCAGGSLPSGMSFAPATRRFAGTPGALFRDSCTYSVTDSSQPAATVSVPVEVEVEGPVTGPLMLPASVVPRLSVGDFYNEPLPAATGGVQPYTYSFTCAGGSLPSGMSFAPATRRFAGTPGALFRDSCTYSVTDSSQPAATVSVPVEVEVEGPVTGPLMLPASVVPRLSVGDFYNEPLPAATGGVQPYTYSFTCAGGSLPSGMSFAPATRRFAGTPGALFRDSCTYSVTDSSQPAATVSVPVEVEVEGPVTGPLMLPASVVPRLSVGDFYNEPLPAATGGVQPYTYSFTCAGGSLPSGMSFAPATRRFAGTPGALFRDSCTYSVTDSSQPAATVSVPVEVEVEGPVTGPLMLPASVVPRLSVGDFYNEPLPAATGGVQPYTYSFTCAGGSLPSGMSFAPATRRFAGTPGALFRDSCTYSVTDSSQPAATVSVPVEVEVEGPVTGPLMLPASVVPGNLIRLRVNERARITFLPAMGGVEPYAYELHCPDPPPGTFPGPSTLPPGLGFGPQTQVLSGTPETEYQGPDCTYRVTDSATPPATFARSVALIVETERTKWRFTQRSLAQRDQSLDRAETGEQTIITLPDATGAPIQNNPTPVYRIPDTLGQRLTFDRQTRNLSYTHPQSNSVPPLGRTFTYRYQVLFGDTVDDTLCIDVSFRKDADTDSDPTNDPLFASVRIHDNAYWDGGEFRCPPVPLQPASASHPAQSNPVHEALGPVHARRALDVAHGAVRDRVRGWTPGAPRVLTAIAPKVGIGSLSGESDGFDYTGSSESVSTGAEIGSDSWQAGLVGSYTRTELHYLAAAGLAERGYRSGEHITEIFSLHPFAAWHMPSGGNVWAALGAGTGQLRHRDDLGFPSWSRSDVQLRAYSAGASVPVADVLSGELEAEAGIESFSFEIEGGDRISSALPTLRGRDWRAGLTWSAPVRGAPTLSVAYKHQTGDGPEGGQLEVGGSVSVDGILDPRLSLISNVEGAFGLGDYEHDSWGLGGGIRFAPGEGGRGFALNLDTRLVSLGDGESSDVGIRGEAGYGLWSGPDFRTVRPYVSLIRYSSDGSLRRALGVDLRNTSDSRVNVEIHDRPGDRFRSLRFMLRHRF